MHQLLKLEKQINIEGIYSFLYHEHGKKFVFRGERHNFWELVYVDSGEIVEFSENNRYLLSQGDVIFHKPMEFHGMTAVNNKPHNAMVITFESNSPAMEFFENKYFTINNRQKKVLSRVLENFESIFGIKYNSENIKDFKLTPEQARTYQIGLGLLEQFLLYLIEENNQTQNYRESNTESKNINTAFVDSIKEYLEDNVQKTLTLEEVCRHFNMSKSYLCQLFKNETGQSIIDCYIDLKIKKAKFLIREGNLNYTQIADILGYSGIHHFSRIFKSRTKMSPSSYENSIK